MAVTPYPSSLPDNKADALKDTWNLYGPDENNAAWTRTSVQTVYSAADSAYKNRLNLTALAFMAS